MSSQQIIHHTHSWRRLWTFLLILQMSHPLLCVHLLSSNVIYKVFLCDLTYLHLLYKNNVAVWFLLSDICPTSFSLSFPHWLITLCFLLSRLRSWPQQTWRQSELALVIVCCYHSVLQCGFSVLGSGCTRSVGFRKWKRRCVECGWLIETQITLWMHFGDYT